MLLFIDEPRNLKLVRQSPEDGTRSPVGKIKKQTLEITDDIRPNLHDGEEDEIAAAFQLIHDGEVGRVKHAVAAFPATVREVLVYYREQATPSEQRWILGALLEGLRLVRRHEREQAS